MSFKYSFPAIVFALAFSSGASAADLGGRHGGGYKDVPYYFYERPVIWHGFYYGGHFGGAFNEADGPIEGDLDKVDQASPEPDYVFTDADFVIREEGDEDDFIAGVHLGYNWQRYGNPLVLGVEGDVTFGGDLDYLASVRARVGYAMHHVMIYLTGGVAFTEFDKQSFSVTFNEETCSCDVFAFLDEGGLVRNEDNSDVEVGLVIGGGLEYKPYEMFGIGLEGLYYLFEDVRSEVSLVSGGGAVTNTFSSNADREIGVIRARVNIHLH